VVRILHSVRVRGWHGSGTGGTSCKDYCPAAAPALSNPIPTAIANITLRPNHALEVRKKLQEGGHDVLSADSAGRVVQQGLEHICVGVSVGVCTEVAGELSSARTWPELSMASTSTPRSLQNSLRSFFPFLLTQQQRYMTCYRLPLVQLTDQLPSMLHIHIHVFYCVDKQVQRRLSACHGVHLDWSGTSRSRARRSTTNPSISAMLTSPPASNNKRDTSNSWCGVRGCVRVYRWHSCLFVQPIRKAYRRSKAMHATESSPHLLTRGVVQGYEALLVLAVYNSIRIEQLQATARSLAFAWSVCTYTAWKPNCLRMDAPASRSVCCQTGPRSAARHSPTV